MRATLTWEEHGGSRSLAGVYERGVLALALVLPVPMLAAAGLSLPLPQSIFRLGVLAAERTALIAEALPGVGRDRPAKKAVPGVHHTTRVAHMTVSHPAPVLGAASTAVPHHAVGTRRSRRHATGTPAHVVAKPTLTPGPPFSGRGQTDPTTDPVTTTPTPSTPAQPATPVKATDTSSTAVVSTPATPVSSATRNDQPATSPQDEQPVQDGAPAPSATPPITTTPVTTTPTSGQGQGQSQSQGQGHGASSGTPTPPGQSNQGPGSNSGSGDKKNATTTVSATG